MQDKRKEQRWPAYLAGRASFFGQQSSADCVVRNTSGAGALLRVGMVRFVPDEFELTIPQRDAVYTAHTRWRDSRHVGVELRPRSGAAEVASDTPSLMERLQRAERKNRKLRQRLAEVGL
jgi:hypothetical protein